MVFFMDDIVRVYKYHTLELFCLKLYIIDAVK